MHHRDSSSHGPTVVPSFVPVSLSDLVPAMCYVTAGTFTRLGLCRLPYDKALVSRVLSISHDE
jgi:hypothetical protein